MNLGDMRTEFKRILNELDSSKTHFSDSQINIWLNEAYRYIMTKLDAVPITERDYSSAETITLNSRTLTINTVRLNVQPANEFQELSIIDIDTLARLDPDWENVEEDIPRYLVRMGTFSARLYPKPNTANTSQTLRTHGLEFPSDLSSDTDIPDLPLNMHDLFAHYAAYRAFSQLSETDRSTSELILVNGLLKSQHSITTKFSNKQNRWKFEDVEQDFFTSI